MCLIFASIRAALTCAGSCNHHGQCTEKGSTTFHLSLLSFLQGQADAFAFIPPPPNAPVVGVCVCNAGWGGADCTTSEIIFAQAER